MVGRSLAVLADHPHEAAEIVVEVEDIRGGREGDEEDGQRTGDDAEEPRLISRAQVCGTSPDQRREVNGRGLAGRVFTDTADT